MSKEDAVQRNRRYAKEYRENRKTMGFKQVTSYVPENAMEQYNIFMEKIRAEHMMEIAKRAPTDPALVLMAGRYFVDLPTPADVRDFSEECVGMRNVMKLVKEVVKLTEVYNTAYNSVRLLESDDEERINQLYATALANNYMASALWREALFNAGRYKREDDE